jgi:hypothetical protein
MQGTDGIWANPGAMKVMDMIKNFIGFRRASRHQQLYSNPTSKWMLSRFAAPDIYWSL